MISPITASEHATATDERPHVTARVGYRGDAWTPTPTPTLSWSTRTSTRDWVQTAAEIEIERPSGIETARIHGDASVEVAWPFAPLAPREEATIRVRVTGSEWSQPIVVRAGFLAHDEWTAQLVGNPDTPSAPVLLRTEFEVPSAVRRATLYATAHGVYQAFINGDEVDDERLKPGWTSYQWRVQYDTTDVTSLVRAGWNAIGITAAGGWYTERFGFFDAARPVYGTEVRAAALLVVELVDGSILRLATDPTWRATGSTPIVSSGIYAGETYDARREQAGWSEPGFDDGDWSFAAAAVAPVTPVPRIGPPVRATDELSPVAILRSPSGKTIVDFGQNLVGHVRLTVSGTAGETVTLRHAEVLDGGELAIRPLRAADATDRYILAGRDVETWEPQFTFHGFRYIEVEGWPGELTPDALVAVVVHSDLQRTGWFETSDPLLARLHENVVWSMRGNFLSVPTDCPQRDERLGWTGDIQVFAPTASFLYDCNGFLAGWLEDLRLEQAANGGLPPHVVPDVLGESLAAAGWGDATTVVPWTLYERFGNRSILEKQFDSMRDWVDHVLAAAGDRYRVEDGFQYGDWLDPDAPPDLPGKAKADRDLVATAYLYRSASLLAAAADVLGRTEEARFYGSAAAKVKEAFAAEYLTANGRLVSDAPSAYALAIAFDLVDDRDQVTRMGDRLAFLTRKAGYRISTGFLGTPVIADALTATGHLDVAERLLLQTENPSWLYPVTMGATTIWERWDSLLEDGTVNPGGMTSFNHYALGAIADWMHRSLAGLAPAAPGYRRIRIAPRPFAGLEFARARLDSPYGPIEVGWRRAEDLVIVTAKVPPNTSAIVDLPGAAEVFEIGSGDHEWTVPVVVAENAHPPLSLESALAQIVDDPEAYRVLIAAFSAHDPQSTAVFRRYTDWTPGNLLREALNRAPQPLVADVANSFAAINTRRHGAA